MAKTKRKRSRKEWVFKNFETVLVLPERLAQYLRLWFHLSKAQWDFMLDKLRQEKAREAQWMSKAANKGKIYRAAVAYREWSKSKGRGKGRRYFAAPCDELKLVQKAILNQLLGQISVHFCRHGYQRGSSILTNVAHHAGFAKTVFAVDIVNAYPSVYRSRVRAVLRKPFEFGLRQFSGVEFSESDRTQLLEATVDLLVWKDRLPQGPPTSPRMFNIVCGKMDQALFQLLETSGTPLQSYRLTVWADNIVVSSDGDIPKELRQQIVETIRQHGFFVHQREDKMKYFSPETGEVPVVTGLVIGREGLVTMAPAKVNQLRGRLTRLCRVLEGDPQTRGEVAGILGFVRQVYPHSGRRLPSRLREVVEKAERRFGKKQAEAPVPKTVKAKKRPTKIRAAKKSTTKAKPVPRASRPQEVTFLPEALSA